MLILIHLIALRQSFPRQSDFSLSEHRTKSHFVTLCALVRACDSMQISSAHQSHPRGAFYFIGDCNAISYEVIKSPPGALYSDTIFDFYTVPLIISKNTFVL